MIGLAGIILSLVLLIVFAYRGVNVIILAPLMALLATAFAGGLPMLATYTQVFMPALGNYLITYFPLFLLGALFGKLMDDSGAARAIAYFIVEKLGDTKAILAIVLACGILTYGGVSLFVVAFAVFPIAAALFREAGVPKRLIPATIALGSFTFTMTALPGTPQIQNAIPAPFFGTNAFAAPGLGIIAALIMFGGGTAWLMYRAKRLTAAGEVYLPEEAPKGGGLLSRFRGKKTDRDAPSGAVDQAGPIPGGSGTATATATTTEPVAVDQSTLPRPSVLIAFLPIFVVIALNYVLVTWVFPAMDTDYLSGDAYGNTDIDTVGGIWAIVVALVVSCLLVVATNVSRFGDVKESVNSGTMGSFLPIFNTASEVGYGAVIASLPAFRTVRDSVLGISNNPVISLAVAVNVLAGITGSASGGMSIALQTLGEQFRGLADAQGISLELMHRVTVLAAGGFDALPHNGAVVTVLAICGLTHRQSYKDIFVVAVAIPLVALVVVITLGTAFGGF
ncbi:putative transporter [Nocardioides dokdonensis FR1436]|uniref:Putative transporter n=1 Tax=Nocardioides dokdonensis FR1436 TaxID=1300347 RepID=A0A1A9GMJ2_9ACTN|nr:GntP family permease [Nocardioides dokdonensis]ANH38675.1 putative transporter [Nocardioides dokdonensis FR1436]